MSTAASRQSESDQMEFYEFPNTVHSDANRQHEISQPDRDCPDGTVLGRRRANERLAPDAPGSAGKLQCSVVNN